MSIWWLIPAFVGLVGVLMLVGGIMAVFKAKLGSGLLRVLFGGLTLAGAMIVGLIGLNLQTYAALSKERLAGQLVLKKTGDHVLTARARRKRAGRGGLTSGLSESRVFPSGFP